MALFFEHRREPQLRGSSGGGSIGSSSYLGAIRTDRDFNWGSTCSRSLLVGDTAHSSSYTEKMAASAYSYRFFMRFSSSSPLLPCPLLKSIQLLPASSRLSASRKSQLSQIEMGSRRSLLVVRTMVSDGGHGEVEVPKSVPVRVAQKLLQAGHRYLDVRTPEEFTAGHAIGAVNVPYMFKVGSGMTKNPKFLEEVSLIFGKDDEIIVGCQMGKRSLMAATDLTSAGFTGITDIAGGYSAWIQNGLPSG